MEKNEILEAIRENIAGQGSMVDISGKLPGIFEALVGGAEFAQKTTITLLMYPKIWDENEGFVVDSEAEGTIIVKGFSKKGETLPVREIPFKMASGSTVEIEATIGDTIGVVGKVPGKGASCQYVQKVVGPVTMQLEIYPAGIYEIGDGILSPALSGDMYKGCVVVSEDFAVALPPHQREGWDSTYHKWGGQWQRIPFVLKTKNADEANTDFDGALNTAAILSVVDDNDCAAKVATIMPEPFYVRFGAFLPSAGILKYLYEHRTEINAFIEAATEEYSPEVDYQTIPDVGELWSSTDDDKDIASNAWYVALSSGRVLDNSRFMEASVFVVSAFRC